MKSKFYLKLTCLIRLQLRDRHAAMIETCTFEIINVVCLFAFDPLRLPVHYGVRPCVRRGWQDLQHCLQGGLRRGCYSLHGRMLHSSRQGCVASEFHPSCIPSHGCVYCHSRRGQCVGHVESCLAGYCLSMQLYAKAKAKACCSPCMAIYISSMHLGISCRCLIVTRRSRPDGLLPQSATACLLLPPQSATACYCLLLASWDTGQPFGHSLHVFTLMACAEVR